MLKHHRQVDRRSILVVTLRGGGAGFTCASQHVSLPSPDNHSFVSFSLFLLLLLSALVSSSEVYTPVSNPLTLRGDLYILHRWGGYILQRRGLYTLYRSRVYTLYHRGPYILQRRGPYILQRRGLYPAKVVCSTHKKRKNECNVDL